MTGGGSGSVFRSIVGLAGLGEAAVVVVSEGEEGLGTVAGIRRACMIASVRGSSSASRRMVGAVFGVRHVALNMSSAWPAASSKSLVESAGPSPTWRRGRRTEAIANHT